jgi:pimeloyl-ACP methyl ester carboxylesterase
MKRRETFRALLGMGLCGLGLWLALSVPYHPRTFRVAAGGCFLITDIVEPAGGGPPQGYVVLLHGLAANKRIMSYFTQGFAALGLRVFVPDLPGHGRTAGPFSYARAEQCSENLVRELLGRGLLNPERTILAGHSLGGAMALRVASRFPVAGVVAISPAPMHPIRGIPPELVPFSGFGATPANSLVLAGTWEFSALRDAAKDLIAAAAEGTGRYQEIPHATHVSMLFDAKAMTAAQDWVIHVLRLRSSAKLPSHRPILGFFCGLAGILLLAGPFLRELLQAGLAQAPAARSLPTPAKRRLFLEYLLVSLGVAGTLALWNPLRAVHLFEGNYCAGLMLLLGLALLALHSSSWWTWPASLAVDAPSQRSLYVTLLAAAFAAFILLFLFTAWADVALTEAWATRSRWLAFLPLFGAALPYHVGEEFLLGPPSARAGWRRLLLALFLRAVVWLAVLLGILVLHSGEVLPVLLVPYFFVVCLLQRWAMDVVRKVTASPAASALFGAILLAGFCLVAFPAT